MRAAFMPAVGEAGSEQDRTIDDLWRYPPLQKGLHCHEGLLIDDRRHFEIDPLGGGDAGVLWGYRSD